MRGCCLPSRLQVFVLLFSSLISLSLLSCIAEKTDTFLSSCTFITWVALILKQAWGQHMPGIWHWSMDGLLVAVLFIILVRFSYVKRHSPWPAGSVPPPAAAFIIIMHILMFTSAWKQFWLLLFIATFSFVLKIHQTLVSGSFSLVKEGNVFQKEQLQEKSICPLPFDVAFSVRFSRRLLRCLFNNEREVLWFKSSCSFPCLFPLFMSFPCLQVLSA